MLRHHVYFLRHHVPAGTTSQDLGAIPTVLFASYCSSDFQAEAFSKAKQSLVLWQESLSKTADHASWWKQNARTHFQIRVAVAHFHDLWINLQAQDQALKGRAIYKQQSRHVKAHGFKIPCMQGASKSTWQPAEQGTQFLQLQGDYYLECLRRLSAHKALRMPWRRPWHVICLQAA